MIPPLSGEWEWQLFFSFLVFAFYSHLGSAPNCGSRRITSLAVLRGARRYSSCVAKVVVPHLTPGWQLA